MSSIIKFKEFYANAFDPCLLGNVTWRTLLYYIIFMDKLYSYTYKNM